MKVEVLDSIPDPLALKLIAENDEDRRMLERLKGFRRINALMESLSSRPSTLFLWLGDAEVGCGCRKG